MRFAVLFLAFAPFAYGAESVEIPKPVPTKGDEPLAREYSPSKAAAYLDGVGVNWTRDRACFSCHTNMAYMLGRPTLPGDAWKEVRTFAEKQSADWEKGIKPRGPAYVVVNAFVLAFNDAQTTRTLNPRTRYSLDRMWDEQLATGEWKWLKCEWPPMEHDDYYGAVLAAIAAGTAPEGYAKSDRAAAGLAKLKTYLAKTPAPDIHHRAMLLWASTKLDGLLSAAKQKEIVTELKGKQLPDGGWSLASLGEYKRRDGTPNDKSLADGYGTGLAVYVLLQAGVPANDSAITNGVTWLKSHQRESGRWYTRSLSNDKAHYITNAGSAFAALAIHEASK